MSWSGAASGGLSGAATGATIGSVVPGVGTAIGAAAGGLIGAIGGGLAGRKSSAETRLQKKKKELVDQLLGSLNGEGPYADLFKADEAAFEKSFAEPARARFRNQTSPQIQQSYIAGGQQRSTGLEDTLTRAGVDMDQLLNQYYMDYQQQAQNRKLNAITGLTGGYQDPGRGQSLLGAAGQGAAGYLSSESFGKDLESILGSFNRDGPKQTESITDIFNPPRKGFENDNPIYNPYTGVQQ